MLKSIFFATVLSIFAIASLHAQTNITYYGLNGETISQKELKKQLDHSVNIIGTKETEQGTEKRLFLRTQTGQLEPAVLEAIQNAMAKLPEAPLSETLIINYYPGKDKCNSTGIATRQSLSMSYQKYVKALKKEGDISQFNLYKNEEGLKRYSLKRNWQPDPNALFEQIFFDYHFPCSSYVIIQSDGKYIAYYGESNWEQIIMNLQVLKS